MRNRLALLLVCLGMLPGCGQRGPLVLPDRHTRTPVIAKPQTPPPAPAPPAPPAATQP